MIERIIFGGQTGTDLGGLKAAKNQVLKWVILLRKGFQSKFHTARQHAVVPDSRGRIISPKSTSRKISALTFTIAPQFSLLLAKRHKKG